MLCTFDVKLLATIFWNADFGRNVVSVFIFFVPIIDIVY